MEKQKKIYPEQSHALASIKERAADYYECRIDGVSVATMGALARRGLVSISRPDGFVLYTITEEGTQALVDGSYTSKS